MQLEPVVTVRRRRLIGESSLVENWVHEVTGSVASKGPPCAVRSVRAWRKPHHQDPPIWVAEPGHGFPPVVPTQISPTLLTCNLLAVGNQARALCAGNDFAVEDGEPGSRILRRQSSVVALRGTSLVLGGWSLALGGWPLHCSRRFLAIGRGRRRQGHWLTARIPRSDSDRNIRGHPSLFLSARLHKGGDVSCLTNNRMNKWP